MNKHTLNKAIKKAGSQAELARILGVTRQLICNIKRGFPAGEAFINKIEKYLGEWYDIITGANADSADDMAERHRNLNRLLRDCRLAGKQDYEIYRWW